jgi:ubiquinone/menaquinone biosynthesis C-methylase UbiE
MSTPLALLSLQLSNTESDGMENPAKIDELDRVTTKKNECMRTRAIPDYLIKHYDFFYVRPLAVRVFERQWLVNLILLGNYRGLSDAALDALGLDRAERTLQLGCVYGDLSSRILERSPAGGQLYVVDPLSVQLSNLRSKLGQRTSVVLEELDASSLPYPDSSFDRVLAFFLFHEQPEQVRKSTIDEALRVLKPGGRFVIVDYGMPQRSLLAQAFLAVVSAIEPFVYEFIRTDLERYLRARGMYLTVESRVHSGGLYRLLIIERAA